MSYPRTVARARIFHRPPVPRSRLSGPEFAPDERWAPHSVMGTPTRATIPLNKLAPEAALRRLELTIVRRLEGFLHGDHLGLLPGPGSDERRQDVWARRGRCAQIDWAVTARTTFRTFGTRL